MLSGEIEWEGYCLSRVRAKIKSLTTEALRHGESKNKWILLSEFPGDRDQIRSYHSWGLFMDEAAFMPEAGEAYDHAVPVCQKIVVVSSAGPGWFADFVNS